MPVEQALYHILSSIVLQSDYCRGRVLNVGLGPGVSARAFLWGRFVDSVTSVERDQSVILDYRATFHPEEFLESGRHLIVQGDAATVPAAQLKAPFQFVYIDTLSAFTPEVYDNLKAVVSRLREPGMLAPSGTICIEWQADASIERDARKWMEEQGWKPEVVRPALADRGWGRAAQMLVYHP